jgi:hypothetical protein
MTMALVPYPLLCSGFRWKNHKRAPNIVLLFVDDFGWGDVAYRRHVLAFPKIDRLMREGITFTDAYAASPTCSPSRASVLTAIMELKFLISSSFLFPGNCLKVSSNLKP